MKINVELDVVPFAVPREVEVVTHQETQLGAPIPKTMPLTALDYNALSIMCDEFRARVFVVAKVKDERRE
jgi:hypothetical protein